MLYYMDRKQPAGCIFLQQDNKLFAGGLKSGVSHIQGGVCSKTTPLRRTRNGKIRGGDTDGEESGIIENNHYEIGREISAAGEALITQKSSAG